MTDALQTPMRAPGAGASKAPCPFLALGADRFGVRLRALWDMPPGPPLRAFLRGIELGRIARDTPLAAGAEITLPITRFPRIEPPMELRFAAERDGAELAAPWPIADIAQATALVGSGTPIVSALRLEAGVLRGYLENAVNGWMQPLLHARINGQGARAVHTDPPQPLAAGGAGCRFAIPLLAADLREGGLDVTLYAADHDAPLAHWAWTRAEGAGTARLEARLEALERDLTGIAARLQAAQDAAHTRQQERIDAFIAAAATLLFDRIAAPPRIGGALSPETAALRALIAAAGAPPEAAAAPLRLARQVVLAPDAGEFGLGWHPPERDADGPFRWMGGTGLVMNPEPERAVAGIVIAVAHRYRADAATLRATLDGAPCIVTAHDDTLHITPEAGATAARALLLRATDAGVPAQRGDGGDHRQLSLAVARIAFDYAP